MGFFVGLDGLGLDFGCVLIMNWTILKCCRIPGREHKLRFGMTWVNLCVLVFYHCRLVSEIDEICLAETRMRSENELEIRDKDKICYSGLKSAAYPFWQIAPHWVS